MLVLVVRVRIGLVPLRKNTREEVFTCNWTRDTSVEKTGIPLLAHTRDGGGLPYRFCGKEEILENSPVDQFDSQILVFIRVVDERCYLLAHDQLDNFGQHWETLERVHKSTFS